MTAMFQRRVVSIQTFFAGDSLCYGLVERETQIHGYINWYEVEVCWELDANILSFRQIISKILGHCPVVVDITVCRRSVIRCNCLLPPQP